MTRETYATLESILSAIIKIPEGSLGKLLEDARETRWDSLTQVSIIMAIESEFAIKLKAGDYSRVNTLEALVSLLEEKGL